MGNFAAQDKTQDDPVIIEYFKGTNIKVEFATKHDNHIDVRLK